MNIFNNLSIATAGVAFIVLRTVGSAQATTLVIPTGIQQNPVGYVTPSASGSPFNISQAAQPLSSQRYQQVYAASEFQSLSGPQQITRISFRPDWYTVEYASGYKDLDEGRAFSSTLPDIQINLSTTSKAPDGLSATFAENVGPNDTVVHNRGPLALSSADTIIPGSFSATVFDINIDLQTPFLYNPAAGNLLLDVRNFGGGSTTFFDFESNNGDPVSSVLTGTSGNVNSVSGLTDTGGLRTQFTVTNVSTPSPPPTEIPFEFSPSLGLLMLGAWGAIAQLNSLMQKRKSSGSAFSKN